MHKSVQPTVFKKMSVINSLLSALKSEPAIEEMKRVVSLRKVQEWRSEELLRYNLCGVNPHGCDHICFFDQQSKDIKRSSSWTIIHNTRVLRAWILPKKSLQIHFVTEDGEITDKSTKRAEFLDFFRNRGKCLIGMEACGSSQDWARKLEAMGHEVHLMSPKAVKPFVSGQKNDHNDAIGIYKAMFNGVRRVPVKSTEIRDLQTLRRIRSQVTKDKVKEINHVRGLLAE